MRQRRVLIVEDDAAIRGLLDIVIARQKVVAVESVANGRDALALLQRNHYCLLVLDLMMPFVSGYDVLAGLAGVARRPDVVLVTTAGKPREEDLDSEVVSAIVAKPFDVFRFGELVAEVMQSAALKAACPLGGPDPIAPDARPDAPVLDGPTRLPIR